MPSPPLDLVVVGGGAMGLATAWWAARQGRQVLVLEQFEVGHDRGSSHGAGRIFRLAYADPRYVTLARRARELWSELEATSGTSLLTVTGGIDHGSPAVLAEVEQALQSAGAGFERLTAAEASERWPGMRFDEAAVFQPDAGVLDAGRTVTALHALLLAAGGTYRSGARVESVRQLPSGAAVVVDGTELRARVVVVAAGAWAGPLLGSLVPPLRVTQEQPAFFPTSSPFPVFIHHHSGTTPQLGPGPLRTADPGAGAEGRRPRHGAGRRPFAPATDRRGCGR